MSHDLIDERFFSISEGKGLVWLRVEAFILHVACQDMKAANELLDKAKQIYKKSCILSASNKIIIEIRGSELVEMPLYKDGKLVYCGELEWLTQLVNEKLQKMWERMEKFRKKMI